MGPMAQRDHGGNFADILAICQRINSERDLGALLDLIAREAIKLVDCERASIFLLDRERNELWSKVALGSDEILRFDASSGIAGAAVTSGEIVNVLDAYSDPRFYTDIDSKTGYRTRTILVAPLRNQSGKIIGAFEALNKHAGVFNRGDEEALRTLGSHAAIAIETAQLIGELRRSQDELVAQNTHLWREVEGRVSSHGIIGSSARVQHVVRLIERIRDSLVNVLITGESGTGKEMAARAVHFTSPRARKPFVALNCAALPETLIESELFGIEKGVATGVNQRIGQFEKANGGTLFLDEIGDLSMTAQAKILRVLQERMVERIGGRGPVPVDVRLLAATNKDLDAEIAKGNFREDLYYRIKVVHIQMPPLRDVREDVPLLARHFLKEYCREMGREPMEFSPAILRKLMSSPWPGNVRQLRNEVMRLAACAQGNTITEEDLFDDDLVAGPAPPQPPPGVKPQSLKKAIAELERQMIQETLTATRNNQQQTARLLGLSRQGLINKLKRYTITA
jgi:Nif-specific regulatory protein